MNSTRKLGLLDLLLLLTVMAMAGYYQVVKIDHSAAPAEDAAMLMRYAQHLGDGQGIVWNVGETPVDGATDFLFMVLVGGLYRLGISLEDGVRGLGIAAHFVTLLVVYGGSLRMSGGRRWAAWLSAAFLAIGPGLRYSEASFGTPFFALFAALTWLMAVEASDHPGSNGRAVLFAFCSLVMGLIRPEGVLVGGLIMLAILVRNGFKQSRRILLTYLAVNLLLGGAYFLWRWNMFGYLLPNPFYRKGGGLFYGASLDQAFNRILTMSGPFWLAYLYGLVLWLWLGLKQVFKAGPILARFLRKLAGILSTEWRKTANLILRIGAGVMLAAFIFGATRVSSPVHAFRLFDRYSPAFALFLGILLVAAVVLFAVGRWIQGNAAKDLAGLTVHLQSFDKSNDSMSLRQAARQALFLILPAAGYILMWGLLSDEMNYLGRFQYALIPIMLISWPGFFIDFKETWGSHFHYEWKPAGRYLAGLVLIILSLTVLWNQYHAYLFAYQKDGRYDMAMDLQAFDGKGYTMAVTEAGLLPLYSGWQAIDAWGLNDSYIAHHGGIDAAYLDRYRPEVIMFHADFSPLFPPAEAAEDENDNNTWNGMVMTLKNYAELHDYELAAVYGTNPRDTHYYYVKRDFVDSAAIIQKIRAREDEGYIFGARSINFIYYQRSENVR